MFDLRMNPALYEGAWTLVTKWLRKPPCGNSLHVFPISPYVSSCSTHFFPSLFGYLPCFPWYFSLFPIWGLTRTLTTQIVAVSFGPQSRKISLVLEKQNIYLSGFPTEGSYTKLYSFRWRFINDTYDKTLSVRRFAK